MELKSMDFKGQKFRTVTITTFLFYHRIKLEFVEKDEETLTNRRGDSSMSLESSRDSPAKQKG